MFQTKRQGDTDGVIHLFMAFKTLDVVGPNPGVPGQVFMVPTKHRAGLHAVPWGELMKDDLLIYGGAHCQRGHRGSPGIQRGRTNYTVFLYSCFDRSSTGFFLG